MSRGRTEEEVSRGGERSGTSRGDEVGGGGCSTSEIRPLIIHGALSTPIEGENHSCEPESSPPPQRSSSSCLPLLPSLYSQRRRFFPTRRLLFTPCSLVASGAFAVGRVLKARQIWLLKPPTRCAVMAISRPSRAQRRVTRPALRFLAPIRAGRRRFVRRDLVF